MPNEREQTSSLLQEYRREQGRKKKKKATNEFLADPHIFLDSEDSPKVQD